jgi:hypothetical protein
VTALAELSALAVFADGGEAKKAGPLWFAVVLVLAVACYFLFRSMSRHLRKVREQFPTEQREPDPTAAPDQQSER